MGGGTRREAWGGWSGEKWRGGQGEKDEEGMEEMFLKCGRTRKQRQGLLNRVGKMGRSSIIRDVDG